MRLENKSTVLEIDLNGGAYTRFERKDLPVNPMNWVHNDPVQPAFKGHFLCFDRWGPPSEAERANGFLHHGEVNLEEWKLSGSSSTGNSNECTMSCILPKGKLEITRNVRLLGEESAFIVTEEIKNHNEYGRMFNIVQHVTIAPPFLDKTALFDNNTEKGFEDREDGTLNQEEPVLHWPDAVHNGEKINLRQFRDDWPRVSSFVYNESETYGWVTASNPDLGLMLGYIWKTIDYPWINFWRSMANGEPAAFGMEFGTTGLHEPFPVVAKKGKIFDRNIYEFIDANEVLTKSFIGFLAKIPDDFKGVQKIRVQNQELVIEEKSINGNRIKIKTGNKGVI